VGSYFFDNIHDEHWGVNISINGPLSSNFVFVSSIFIITLYYFSFGGIVYL